VTDQPRVARVSLPLNIRRSLSYAMGGILEYPLCSTVQITVNMIFSPIDGYALGIVNYLLKPSQV
jgi:hypothetical protein